MVPQTKELPLALSWTLHLPQATPQGSILDEEEKPLCFRRNRYTCSLEDANLQDYHAGRHIR
jgi:hypothetical protein